MGLRILEFETVDSGRWGTETHVTRLCEGLSRRGHTIGVAAIPGGYVATACAGLGATVIPLHLRRRGDWPRFFRLVRLLLRFRPDVVHVHSPVEMGLVGVATSLLKVPARFCTRHSLQPFSNPRSGPSYARMYHRFVAVSESVRRFNIEQCGVPADRIVTIYPGLDIGSFPDATCDVMPWRGDTVPKEAVVAALVGRMTEEKGHALFLEALARTEGVTGLFVGDGPLRADLEALAARLGVADRVIWAGTQADVTPWIAACDIACVPSVKPEGLGWVALEAMACGKPVVASNAWGLPEAVLPGTGMLVPPGDAEALAKALSRLTRDRQLRMSLGGAARRSVAERFDAERWVENTVRLYQSVLG